MNKNTSHCLRNYSMCIVSLFSRGVGGYDHSCQNVLTVKKYKLLQYFLCNFSVETKKTMAETFHIMVAFTKGHKTLFLTFVIISLNNALNITGP